MRPKIDRKEVDTDQLFDEDFDSFMKKDYE